MSLSPVCLTLALALPWLACSRAAELSGSDDFNDNTRDPLRWGPSLSLGSSRFAEQNGRLDLASEGVAVPDLVFLPWILVLFTAPSAIWRMLSRNQCSKGWVAACAAASANRAASPSRLIVTVSMRC